MARANAGDLGSRTYPVGTIGFYSWNVPENRLYGDDVIAHIYCATPAELAAGVPIEKIIQYIDEPDRRRVAKAIHTAIVTGERYDAEYHMTHVDGRILRVAANGCCLRDADGTPSIYTGTSTILPLHASADAVDPLEVHCRAALGLATKRRHALAARYLSSALRVLGA
ncbi:PAS domain-containing protein [Neorhizobium lilium]|nr:PAS domain-containing protein [Neorhizobium lilium]